MPDAAGPRDDAGRTEFGFARTACACADCVRLCRHLPGYLVPADLERLRRHLAPAEDLLTWAETHLLASPGALVVRAGTAFRIPTLVPARRAGGACRFLTPEGRCAVHAAAPFGCAFFDCLQTDREADRRSRRGLRAVLEAWREGGPYAQVWLAMHAAGRCAPAPEVCRRQLRQARDRE